jgi:DDE superfamily endonuclease
VTETISADGSSLDSLVIVTGKYGKEEWFNEEYPPAVVMSEKGWTSNEIGLIWLKQHFEPRTRPPNVEDRVLIVDGHDSHCSIDFIEFWDAYRIHLLILSPHITHKL